jgi:hypothetical protein
MGWAARANHIARAAKSRSPKLRDLVEQRRMHALAADLRDEAELQRVLSGVEPSMRDAVERAVRPFCRFVTVEGV